MFARPLHGRILFEEIMRENLDIGRPDHVQLIFGWRIARRTPSRFGTRTITVRVQLSLHMDDKCAHQAGLQGRTCPANGDGDQRRL